DDDGNDYWEYDIRELGYKYHGNSVAAALALVGLKYLDQDNVRRRELAALYREHLSALPGVTFVEHEEESARHLCQILVDNRNQLIAALKRDGISTGVHYKDNRRYAPFAGYRYDVEGYQDYTDKILSLPMHLELLDEDISRIAEAIKINL
ncbi:MAG: DegT/DnrJ/EryC1/StrS family aminotransferase, partial [Pseudomonadales bacterium]|nr:DegT/DnrJ/EryC1/StrS family aminotransferase [Pseudomonadales bacterium]